MGQTSLSVLSACEKVEKQNGNDGSDCCRDDFLPAAQAFSFGHCRRRFNCRALDLRA
jgi:hypothetical protein